MMMDLRRSARPPLRPAFLLVLALLAAGIAMTGCGRTHPRAASTLAQHARYRCPMHPSYVSDRPGQCPICGMDLVPIEPAAASGPSAAAPVAKADPAAAAGPRRVLYYRNPMDPSVTSPVPMKDAMGMNYLPVYSDEAAVTDGVDGNAAVEIGPGEARLTGIQTAVARQGTLPRTIRTVGEVKADETRVRQVQARVSGWIEQLSIVSSGQAVRQGQTLARLDSPELLATQQEFLRARASAARFAGSDVPEVRSGGQDLLEAARSRMQLLGMSPAFIERLERTGQPVRSVAIEAPVSGFVTTRDVVPGMRIEPGTTLFTVTDLSRVWVEGRLYESDIPRVRAGQEARVTLPNAPGVEIRGRVQTVYPTLDADTRTLRVRLEVGNRGLALKPGMFADVELRTQPVRGVLVPESAVLETGPRQVVFVRTGEGRFEPRTVSIGLRSDGQAQVLSGIAAGEAVVVRANFLLDSESRLRAALARTTAGTAQGGTP
jgi:multidrug efflux pump subunit AcrA (membrane-fusion protein)